jgi:hypothetical protein
MYVRSSGSLHCLEAFIDGYTLAAQDHDPRLADLDDRDFRRWVAERFGVKAQANQGWSDLIMRRAEADRQDPIVLFFALLVEYDHRNGA